jgi:hypothetical protein
MSQKKQKLRRVVSTLTNGNVAGVDIPFAPAPFG